MSSAELVAQIRSNIEILLSIKPNDKPATLQSLESMEGFPNETHSVQSLLSNYNTDINKLDARSKLVVPSVIDANKHLTETLPQQEHRETTRSDMSLNTV